jgi:WD40 repeat protein
LRPARKWRISASSAWHFDSDLARYATNDPDGNIFVRDVEGDRLLATLPGHGLPLTALIASHDLRFMAAIDRAGTARIWDMQTSRARILDLPDGRLSTFTADGRRLVVKLADGSLAQFEAETGTPRESWRGPFGFTVVAFNGDGTLFFGISGSDVLVHETTTGARVAKLTHPEGVVVAAWHPGGKRIAVGCGATIHVWDLEPKRLVGEWGGHESRVVGLCYDPSGELLISTGWDSTTRLWKDGPRESVRAASGGNAPRISTDGRRMAFRSWDHSRVELWEVASGAEMRRFAPFSGAGRVYRQTHRAGFHPNGTLLYIDASDGTHLYRVDTFQQVATLNAQTGSQATFSHSGNELFTIAQGNVRAWPVTAIRDELQLGAPRLLLRNGTARHLATSPQSDLLVTTDHDGFHVFTLGEAEKRSITTVRSPGLPSISADGRWLATGRDSRLTLWDLGVMRAVTNFTVGPEVRGVFSPDNRWLIGASRTQHQVWELGSWKLRFNIDRREARTAWPAAAFSPDGTVAALSTPEHAVRLVETGGFQELATLPASRMITHLCFSPDSTRLLVLYEPGVAELWNLSLVRDRLNELKLGWNHPFPRIPAASEASPPKMSSHLGNKVVLRGQRPDRAGREVRGQKD